MKQQQFLTSAASVREQIAAGKKVSCVFRRENAFENKMEEFTYQVVGACTLDSGAVLVKTVEWGWVRPAEVFVGSKK